MIAYPKTSFMRSQMRYFSSLKRRPGSWKRLGSLSPEGMMNVPMTLLSAFNPSQSIFLPRCFMVATNQESNRHHSASAQYSSSALSS